MYFCKAKSINIFLSERTFMTKSTKSPSLRLVHFGICIRLIFENLKNSLHYIPLKQFQNFTKISSTDSKSSPKERSKYRSHYKIKEKLLFVFVYFRFSSLCEFIRICHLGNRAVTDSRNETWKTLRLFGTFQPGKVH